jgi:hypothetical protein
MANKQNLQPWQPGQSGNPSGKPKGTKHLSTWIREMLEDENFSTRYLVGYRLQDYKGAPMQAILQTLITKAIGGDIRAFDLLAKYGYGTRVDLTTMNKELPRPILSSYDSMTDEELNSRLAIGAEKVVSYRKSLGE